MDRKKTANVPFLQSVGFQFVRRDKGGEGGEVNNCGNGDVLFLLHDKSVTVTDRNNCITQLANICTDSMLTES